jgi:hypothetical protein
MSAITQLSDKDQALIEAVQRREIDRMRVSDLARRLRAATPTVRQPAP